jgi:hypothetical protein
VPSAIDNAAFSQNGALSARSRTNGGQDDVPAPCRTLDFAHSLYISVAFYLLLRRVLAALYAALDFFPGTWTAPARAARRALLAQNFAAACASRRAGGPH